MEISDIFYVVPYACDPNSQTQRTAKYLLGICYIHSFFRFSNSFSFEGGKVEKKRMLLVLLHLENFHSSGEVLR